jgi:hypothetical protein
MPVAGLVVIAVSNWERSSHFYRDAPLVRLQFQGPAGVGATGVKALEIARRALSARRSGARL